MFLGVDFGWMRNPSGLAALRFDGVGLALTSLEVRGAVADVLAWIDAQAGGGPAMIAVDAPLVITNPTGMRVADRLAHTYYGRNHAGCYPANLGRPFAARTVEFSKSLCDRGFEHGTSIEARKPCRCQIEVFPHIGAIELFGLDRIIKYKKGVLAARREALGRFRGMLLEGLPLWEPVVHGLTLPEIPLRGVDLKAVEDQLDALLCAYIGAHWWYWGMRRNRVLGCAAEGYIVAPKVRR